MESFLLWIGLYNVVGPIVLAFMHHEPTADFMLRKATEVIAEPYSHGKFGRLWLWWAATSNAGLGVVMVMASRWPEHIQAQVTAAALGVYVAMYLVMLFGARKPRYARGIYVVHALWLGQMAWATVGLLMGTE